MGVVVLGPVVIIEISSNNSSFLSRGKLLLFLLQLKMTESFPSGAGLHSENEYREGKTT